jgi:hypothetical protein
MAMTVEQLITRLKRSTDTAKDAVVLDTASGDVYEISRVEEEEGGDDVKIVFEEVPKL